MNSYSSVNAVRSEGNEGWEDVEEATTSLKCNVMMQIYSDVRRVQERRRGALPSNMEKIRQEAWWGVPSFRVSTPNHWTSMAARCAPKLIPATAQVWDS